MSNTQIFTKIYGYSENEVYDSQTTSSETDKNFVNFIRTKDNSRILIYEDDGSNIYYLKSRDGTWDEENNRKLILSISDSYPYCILLNNNVFGLVYKSTSTTYSFRNFYEDSIGNLVLSNVKAIYTESSSKSERACITYNEPRNIILFSLFDLNTKKIVLRQSNDFGATWLTITKNLNDQLDGSFDCSAIDVFDNGRRLFHTLYDMNNETIIGHYAIEISERNYEFYLSNLGQTIIDIYETIPFQYSSLKYEPNTNVLRIFFYDNDENVQTLKSVDLGKTWI